MNKLTGKYYWLLFMIYPFLSVVLMLKNFRLPSARNLLWAFIVFYGFTFAISNESQGNDIVSYVTQIKVLHKISFTWKEAIAHYQNSEEVDVLRTALAILVSRFTDSQPIFTGIIAFIFGYFYSRNLFYVLDRLQGRLKWQTLLLLFCFALVVPIWNINGYRMWTAMHIFLFGLIPFLVEGRKSKLCLCFLTPMVHYSFLFPVAVLMVYLIAGNRTRWYFYAFIVTLFISEINISTFNTYMQTYLPQRVVERSEGYRIEKEVEQFRTTNPLAEKNWYAVYYQKALEWSAILFLLLLYRRRKYVNAQQRLLPFSLLIFSGANLLSTIPSGGRFLSLALLCTLPLVIWQLQDSPELSLKRLVIFTTPALLLFLIVALRIGFYSFSLVTILGNPLLALIHLGDYVALNDVLKWLL